MARPGSDGSTGSRPRSRCGPRFPTTGRSMRMRSTAIRTSASRPTRTSRSSVRQTSSFTSDAWISRRLQLPDVSSEQIRQGITMKRILLTTVSLGVLSLLSPICGADLPTYSKAPAFAAPVYDWTGVYFGVFGGGGYGNHNINNALGNTGNADFTANYSSTGGYAFGDIDHTNTDPVNGVDRFTVHANGLTAGAGFAYALTNNVIGKFEYRYYNFNGYNRPGTPLTPKDR